MATLYDANGNPIGPTPKKGPITREVAVVGLRDRWDDYPADGLTPERLASIFRDADGGDVTRQMELFTQFEEKDARVSSCLQTRKLAVAGLEWEVVPARERGADPTPDQVRQAEYVDEVLREIANWDDALMDVLDALGKGYSVSEIMWRVSEGDVWVERLEWRDPRKFVWNPTQTELGLVTDQATDGVPLSAYPNKFVVHRYKARSGNAPRAGILRTCAWMYLFKNYAVKDWVVFAEVFGMPLRLGKYDTGASDDEKAALKAAVSSLGSDAAGIISKATEIEFVNAEVSGSIDIYQGLAKLANDEITLAILGQLQSSQGTPGALGGNQAQDEVRQDLLEADAKGLAKTLRGQLAVPLVDYRFGPQARYPTIEFRYEPPEDLTAAAERDKILIEAGVPITVRQMRDKYNIDEAADDDELVVPPQYRQATATPVTPPPAVAARHDVCPHCGGGAAVLAQGMSAQDPARAARAEDQDTLDQGAEALAGQWERLLGRRVENLIALAEETGDLVTFRDRLADLAAEAPPKALTETLARAGFTAHLLGRLRGQSR